MANSKPNNKQMKLTKERQKETGAFYTPKIWADKAVEYMRNFVPNLEDYCFWDMAAGEGALLEALPENCVKYGTTLEREDFIILRDKGFDCNVFDFLNGKLENIMWLKDVPKEKLIIFTNPPFVKLPATHTSYAKTRYGTNDATALFFYRILEEIQPFLLCSFNKMDIWQAPIMKPVRKQLRLRERLNCISTPIFCSPSHSWGLKGEFPIAFNMMLGFDIF
jgi:hypothetical protein